jgi:hypothetical protein
MSVCVKTHRHFYCTMEYYLSVHYEDYVRETSKISLTLPSTPLHITIQIHSEYQTLLHLLPSLDIRVYNLKGY